MRTLTHTSHYSGKETMPATVPTSQVYLLNLSESMAHSVSVGLRQRGKDPVTYDLSCVRSPVPHHVEHPVKRYIKHIQVLRWQIDGTEVYLRSNLISHSLCKLEGYWRDQQGKIHVPE